MLSYLILDAAFFFLSDAHRLCESDSQAAEVVHLEACLRCPIHCLLASLLEQTLTLLDR